MSEWFYIRQWKSNNQKIWCLIDSEGRLLISGIDKFEADLKKIELANQNIKVYVVNKYQEKYNDILAKKRGKDENSNTEI
jgi:hypothetical protein